MEAVKNRLTRFGRDARPVIVDADANFVAYPSGGKLNEAPGRRKTYRIVDDRIDCAGQTIGLAHEERAVLAWPGKSKTRAAGFVPGLPAMDELLDQRAKIHALEGGSGEFSIRSRCLADVADQ